jgi:hypothetical protein
MGAGCTFSPGPPEGISGSAGSAGAAGRSGGHAGSLGTGSGNSSGGGDVGSNPDASCGQKTYPTRNIPGDLLLLLDKSGSMDNQFDDQACGGGACVTKWASMTMALNTVVMNTQGSINWGLKYFANNDTCGTAGPAELPPAPNNAAAIATSIGKTSPGGNTPTRFAVQASAAYLGGLIDPNAKYILLATDGEPNCCTTAGRSRMSGSSANAIADDVNAIAAVRAAYNGGSGVPVFVVGVGSLGAAVTTLNEMAIAGGRAQPADPMGRVYFPADDPAALEAALSHIAGQVRSCTFSLGAAPPDPQNIAVLGDGKQIPKDPVNGWSYGPGMTAVVVNGSACAQVKAGTIQEVQAVFGCPGVTIVIP